jgi:hypothetical protein
MNAPAVSLNVAQRFHELRRRYLSVRITIAIAVAIVSIIGLWLALAIGDYLWEWSFGWRSFGILTAVIGVTAWASNLLYGILRDTRQRKFAALLEDSFEDFGQRIRTVLGTVDGNVEGPDEMLTALGHQTLGRWETTSPSQMIPSKKMLIAVAAAVMASVGAGLLYLGGGEFRVAMGRALGQDTPYTNMKVMPGDAKVLEGSLVEVSLQLTGRTDRDVSLRHRYLTNPSGDESENESETAGQVVEDEWIETELLPLEDEDADKETFDKLAAVFINALGKAKQPVEYQFATSAGSTPVYRLDVHPLIEASRIETVVTPPEYTELETRSFASPSVTVLERSQVSVTIETNHPLTEAKLVFGKNASELVELPLDDPKNRSHWEFELPSAKSVHWKFTGIGIDGTPMMPVKGRLRVRFDKAPKLSWMDPPDEIKVHTLAELPLRVQVSDDYGIEESGIVFQLGGDDEYVLTEWTNEEKEQEEGKSRVTTRARLEQILPLESFGLTERDYVSYYAYAIDNRGEGSHRSESDVRYIDIRPLRQYYSEIEITPGGGGGGRVLTQLDEIIRRERFLINRTRRLLRSSGADLAKQLGAIDRMVESQSELAGLTRFLADFFVSRGNDDVEALNQAETSMLQAADSLAAGNFDLALAQQDTALRTLAEARQTLEISLLKNASPAQQAALRRLARQLRQKLRRDRPATERQMADTLQKIATEQQALGQQATSITKALQEKAAGNTPSPTDESDDGDTVNTEQESSETEQPNEQARFEGLYASQIDLLDRLQAIEEQLGTRLSDSPLLGQRMQEAIDSIDRLGVAAKNQKLDSYESDSESASDQLREMSVQLEALAKSEPVSRVSAVRDMTLSLASMESAFSEQLQTAGAPDSEAEANADIELRRSALRMKRRAETVTDVLSAPVQTGDIETSEVADQLQKFLEETQLLDQLDATQRVAETATQNTANLDRERESEKSSTRAIEYTYFSRMLDDLYRQIVEPRSAQLRKIEKLASQLAKKFKDANESGQNEDNPEIKAEVRQIKMGLKQLGMNQLSQWLSETETSDEEIQQELKLQFGQGENGATKFGQSNSGGMSDRLVLVVTELRARIHEMILQEISTDRDAPIPAEYRRAVDRYFREIAGETSAATVVSEGGLQ